jgi:hypothetical protein
VSAEISERSFEEAIECALLRHGADACPGDSQAVRETAPPFGATPPGGYRKRKPEEYDRTLLHEAAGHRPHQRRVFVLAEYLKRYDGVCERRRR